MNDPGSQPVIEYSDDEYPLERNGIELYLSRFSVKDEQPEKNILLIHGVTYSSHEFDIDYRDYSLVRALAREGYGVWRLDIAGFGRSQEVENGLLPDSDYAAEDINAAVEKIVEVSGQQKIDVLGWSWGTVTVSRFAADHNEHINKLILYAPILCGIGKYDVKEPFHHNTWEHAADDFQKDEQGNIDHSTVDPAVVEMFCSSCWHYDGDSSPNGGRKDVCVDGSERLIDLNRITVPTLVICGDKDPYLDYDLVNDSLKHLPDGSKLEIIEGGSHVVYIEKNCYRLFQDKLLDFLESDTV
ncbi:MAG: alpha/beta hydrolase [Lachnospiraceae bacterium]|nr:alpha/beta hydrolase [Lachnospiraceae bacterium]